MARKPNAPPKGETLLTGKDYTPAELTDLRATFARIREQQQRELAARMRSARRAALADKRAPGIPEGSGETQGADSSSDAEGRR